jgi:FkbM family methyltransferase
MAKFPAAALLQRALARAGFALHRWPANRFDAMGDTLAMLRSRGYVPRLVIDVGANVGDWTDLAGRVFPEARFQLVEPQNACAEALTRFKPPRFVVHSVAVTSPGIETVTMIGAEAADGSSGAFVARDNERAANETAFDATTLDRLFAGDLRRDDRALLKLDIEGHELDALAGATEILRLVEVGVCETRFFDVERSGRPTFADVVQFMRGCSFELYDIAALGSRRRDLRLRSGDVVFVRGDSPLAADIRFA